VAGEEGGWVIRNRTIQLSSCNLKCPAVMHCKIHRHLCRASHQGFSDSILIITTTTILPYCLRQAMPVLQFSASVPSRGLIYTETTCISHLHITPVQYLFPCAYFPPEPPRKNLFESSRLAYMFCVYVVSILFYLLVCFRSLLFFPCLFLAYLLHKLH